MDYEVNPIVKNQPFAGHPRRSGDRSMADTASASHFVTPAFSRSRFPTEPLA